ncbi:hypothetical protein FHX52_0582 [Humibacillus xanthopallidus]|uniref:SUKH superfamily protein n=1 Tax=Humibacillus xanthopallidus TaxID=412689 RepID=A0A543PTU6_9MICO|nr:SMI1/KNR4 family protein [Humibacillus xanthopallidus]TQN47480.1 hypothetical protein FHX52_0582 [Humibacillus xanthopallidus]
MTEKVTRPAVAVHREPGPLGDRARHLLGLGGRPREAPLDPEAWSEVGVDDGTAPGELLHWLVERFGGSSFGSSASYRDPDTGRDVLLGWVLDVSEVTEAQQDLDGVVPRELVPFENDGADNFLLVRVDGEGAGAVVRRLHDAPLDRRFDVVDDSLEHFLAALHPGE